MNQEHLIKVLRSLPSLSEALPVPEFEWETRFYRQEACIPDLSQDEGVEEIPEFSVI